MSNQGNGGIYSKFQERIRRIRLSKLKKKQQNNIFIQNIVKELKQSTKKNPNYYANKKVIHTNFIDKPSYVIKIHDKKNNTINHNIKINKEENNTHLDQQITYIKQNKPKLKKNYKVSTFNHQNNDTFINENKKEYIQQLGYDIIEKLKMCFEEKIDELEILESELYLLNQQQKEEVELKKVEEIKKKINELIKKANSIIEQYNIYKKNYDISYVTDIDDSIIIDNIIYYRDLLNSNSDEKKFVKEYKRLEEFQSLYNNLKMVRHDIEELKLSNEEKIIEYGIRDKKYDNIKLNLVSVLDIDKKCSLEIKEQNEYLSNLMSKVNKINKDEYITYHMKGIGELISQSLKYMGLMIVSPLAGFIPSIAIKTIATKRMIANVYKQLHQEEIKNVTYSFVDYNNEINHHLTDIDYTSSLIEDTIHDVEKLKEDFLMFYNSNIPGYEDTLKNIQKIENKLYHNYHKVTIIKDNLNKNKKLNNDKIKLVKELNHK